MTVSVSPLSATEEPVLSLPSPSLSLDSLTEESFVEEEEEGDVQQPGGGGGGG